MELTGSQSQPSMDVAAVDLGSNSFHMIIARFIEHDIHLIDKMREPVRLAGGLDGGRRLNKEAQRRAIDCLERFGQRIAELPAVRVRAVGTNTLRRAHDSLKFRTRARKALGHEIEVISGHEEARLIYQGVAHTHSYDERNRLVVDIGGGSTEVIIGHGFDVIHAESKGIGCVSFTGKYFPDGEIRKAYFEKAELAAALELRADRKTLRKTGWEAAVGASGTINAVSEVLELNGWGDGGITPDGLRRLRKELRTFGRADRIDLPGVREDRKAVFAGGVSILTAVFRSLKIGRMTVSPGALREGVLYDLVGRISRRDVRDRTIVRLIDQYQVDVGQSECVERAAHNLLDQVRGSWKLDPESAGKVLSWAACLHEIGLALSHSEHHRHGEYLLRNSDMPGFSRDEQKLLATLVRGQRKKIAREIFEEISPERETEVIRLCVIFRLAVLLFRSRNREDPPPLKLTALKNRVEASFPEGWLDGHPLTRADLEREAAYLEGVDIELVLVSARANKSPE